jgi:peptidoglycan hydrolase CwlO-like protein
MKSREELLREAAEHPERLVEYISALQEQLGQTGQELTAAQRDLTQTKDELRQKAEQLAQAQALIAELKRELFGARPTSSTLSRRSSFGNWLGMFRSKINDPRP